MVKKILSLLLFSLIIVVSHAQILINEVVSLNESSYADEDGDFPDWIELYNNSSNEVDLTGWYLSDDPFNPSKWQIGEGTVAANDHVLVFASDKDKRTFDGEVLPWGELGNSSSVYSDGDASPAGNSSVEPLLFAPSYNGLVGGKPAVSAKLNIRDNTGTGELGYSYGGVNLDVDFSDVNLSKYNVAKIKATITQGSKVALRVVQDGTASWLGYNFPFTGNGIAEYEYEIPLFEGVKGLDLSLVNDLEIVTEGTQTTEITVYDVSFELSPVAGMITRNYYTYNGLGTTVAPFENAEILSQQNGVNVISATFNHSAAGYAGIGVTVAEWDGEATLTSYDSLIIEGYLEQDKEVTIAFLQTDVSSEDAYRYRIKGSGETNGRYSIPFDPSVMNLTTVDKLQIEASMQGEVSFTFNDWYFTRTEASLLGNILHTNFKISSSGETLYLSDPSLNLVDEVTIPILDADVSYGRKSDGDADFQFFYPTTPNAENTGAPHPGFCDAEISFSLSPGFYSKGTTLNLTGSSIIRYTLNGSDPTLNSDEFLSPMVLDSTVVIKAACFDGGRIPKAVYTSTYFVDYNTTLPVWSISTDSANFFDEESGIYVLGEDGTYSPDEPHYGANFWEEWEKPVHVEFFETDGSRLFNENAGVQIFGNFSRANPKKSMALFFRKKYGESKLNYPLFPDYPSLNEFDDLILRSGGNGFWHLPMRDAANQTIMKDANFETQKYRPSVVFINGEYWGVHNIREKSNADYFEKNKGIDKSNIDMGSHHYTTRSGNVSGFMEIHNKLRNGTATLNYIEENLDIESFIDYYAFEIYITNYDWPGNNIKYWRESPDGKWQFFAYDTDFSTGIYKAYGQSETQYDADAFSQAFTFTPNVYWPNSDESTLLFRKLMEFPSIKNAFVNRYCDLINSTWKPSNVQPIIDALVGVVSEEMKIDRPRWEMTYADWEDELEVYKEFWDNRAPYARANMKNHLGLDDEVDLTLEIKPAGAGFIHINTIDVTDASWEGTYFKGVPVSIKVYENPGYSFAGWSSNEIVSFDNKAKDLGEINLTKNTSLTANFTGSASVTNIVISEINYHSSPNLDTEDWLEIHNAGNASVDLSGWTLKDQQLYNVFEFPEGTVILKNSYVVVAKDPAMLLTHQPSLSVLGPLGYSLANGGEQLFLYDRFGNEHVNLTYDDEGDWPSYADGNGGTLQLLASTLDYNDPMSWDAPCEGGSPTWGYDPTCVAKPNAIDGLAEGETASLLYPNPTTGKVSLLESESVEVSLFTVYNVAGEMLIQVDAITSLDLSTLESGVYLVALQLENGEQIVQRVVKQ